MACEHEKNNTSFSRFFLRFGSCRFVDPKFRRVRQSRWGFAPQSTWRIFPYFPWSFGASLIFKWDMFISKMVRYIHYYSGNKGAGGFLCTQSKELPKSSKQKGWWVFFFFFFPDFFSLWGITIGGYRWNSVEHVKWKKSQPNPSTVFFFDCLGGTL